MSGSKLPIKACPSCQLPNSKDSGARLHCNTKGSNCTWIVCTCGRTYDIYTGRHMATIIPKKDPNA